MMPVRFVHEFRSEKGGNIPSQKVAVGHNTPNVFQKIALAALQMC